MPRPQRIPKTQPRPHLAIPLHCLALYDPTRAHECLLTSAFDGYATSTIDHIKRELRTQATLKGGWE